MLLLFTQEHPSTESYWRSVILFGRNVASYKFALGKSLLELVKQDKSFVTLQELAEPYSRHLLEHLQHSPKQVTSQSSDFLDICKQYNEGQVSQDKLISTTVSKGFNNVLDAFHIVNNESIPRVGDIISDSLIRYSYERRSLSKCQKHAGSSTMNSRNVQYE